MSEHPNAAIVRRVYEAFAATDETTLRELLRDSTWHIPGENLLAGTYRGLDEILSLFARGRELTEGSIAFEIHDIVGEGEHAVALDRVTGRRPDGRTIDLNRIVITHIIDGTARDVWLNVEDQYTFDEFWA